mgnify:CR=1 FL=1
MITWSLEQYNDLKKYYVGDVIDSNNPTSKKLNDSLLFNKRAFNELFNP